MMREDVLKEFDAPTASLHTQQMADEIVRLRYVVQTLTGELLAATKESSAVATPSVATPDTRRVAGWITADEGERLGARYRAERRVLEAAIAYCRDYDEWHRIRCEQGPDAAMAFGAIDDSRAELRESVRALAASTPDAQGGV